MIGPLAQLGLSFWNRNDLPPASALLPQLAAEPALLGARDANGISSVMWTCYARQAGVRARLLAAHPELDVFEQMGRHAVRMPVFQGC